MGVFWISRLCSLLPGAHSGPHGSRERETLRVVELLGKGRCQGAGWSWALSMRLDLEHWDSGKQVT